ncbi:G patch domain-containing protein 2-like, partial [Stegodyphus dumicola]|uniref:G patch domain-containing protein 2-like n=1 Tax=Stegodyphus dumicola TaxID=202533 RepID=UPI0015AB8D0D
MNSIVHQGVKQFFFIILYDVINMDQLAQDLSNALDGTSDLLSCNKVKKGKTWKCRSKPKCCLIALGSSVPKSSAVSEDSDSSLDNQVPQQMEISMHIARQWSDSDEIISKVNKHNCHLSSWRHCATSMGESDSVNENFQSSREPRRKRKFKRMTVDPPSTADHEFQCLSNVSLFSQKHKRLCNIKSSKISKHSIKSSKLSKLSVSQLSAEMENICRNFTAASCGKRKRCSHERSIECNSNDCKEATSGKNSIDAYRCSNPHRSVEYVIDRACDASSSGVSSSDSECGLTNDESREADDEQSDFFHEPGPVSGVPGFPPLWHDNQLMSDISDPKFKLVLSENIYDVSEARQRFGIQ